MPHTGTVIADHHQFPFGVLDVDFTEPAAHGTLLDTGDEFVAFYTGIPYGPATITVDLVESPPTVVDTESWDVVEETRIHATSPLFVTATDGTAADLPPVPAGDYRLRAHARGRDSHWANEVTEPVETYLITLWLTDNRAAAGPPTIETLVKRDRVWSPGANALPELDTSVVHIRDSNGEVVTVPSQSEQAWEVRHQLAQYGGKPLTPALDAIFTSRKVAGLDRDLLDAIEAATPDTQRALTRWCVRRAFERANLTRYGWVREALDRMDAGTIDEDFPNRTLERLCHDPNAEWTLATGLPAKIGLITQQQAISSYTRALSPRIGPPRRGNRGTTPGNADLRHGLRRTHRRHPQRVLQLVRSRHVKPGRRHRLSAPGRNTAVPHRLSSPIAPDFARHYRKRCRPSVQYWATIGEPSPEDAAHLAQFADRHAREQQRRAQRRAMPAFRKPPRRAPFTKQPAPFRSFSTPNTRPGSNSPACVDTPPVSLSTSSPGTHDHTIRRSVTA